MKPVLKHVESCGAHWRLCHFQTLLRGWQCRTWAIQQTWPRFQLHRFCADQLGKMLLVAPLTNMERLYRFSSKGHIWLQQLWDGRFNDPEETEERKRRTRKLDNPGRRNFGLLRTLVHKILWINFAGPGNWGVVVNLQGQSQFRIILMCYIKQASMEGDQLGQTWNFWVPTNGKYAGGRSRIRLPRRNTEMLPSYH